MSAIIAPMLTEKAALGMDKGLYVLRISASANKKTIAAELKTMHKVEPISIRIVNLPAKEVKFKRVTGRQGEIRKAYVQLKEGQKLAGFELPKQKEEKKSTDKQTLEKVDA